MKLSQNFTKTIRQAPADETAKNAQLLIRAGYIHKAMPGVYAMLPLGLKTLRKIESIIRDGMDSIGCQETLMSNLQPKDWWIQVDNRWETIDILFHVPSQTKTEYALSQSNEEQVTLIAKNYLNSYKDVPDTNKTGKVLAIYQIHTKFRDELRAKAGLMRGREFRMKDMYDFHLTQESQDAFYEIAKNKYSEIYKSLGLEAYCTRASGGSFSKFSHEFQVITEAGEDWLVCWSDGSKDNLEISKGRPINTNKISNATIKLRENLSENIKSAKEHAENSNLGKDRILKCVLFESKNGDLLGVSIRGDLNINEELLRLALEGTKYEGIEFTECQNLESVGTIRGRFTSVKEYQSNIKKPILWIFDKSIEGACAMVSSLWENVDVVRDCVEPLKYDYLCEVKVGFVRDDNEDVVCEDVLRSAEAGNIFKLGTKWTKETALNLTIQDQNNKQIHPLMGCYGIGVTRCMGLLAEIYSDEKGLKLPVAVAPFEIHLITGINEKDAAEINARILDIANRIYDGELKLIKTSRGKYTLLDTTNTTQLLALAKEDSTFDLSQLSKSDEILWDDRGGKTSIGEKLKDADLIGCPIQIVISKKSLENGGLELIVRETSEKLTLVV